MLLKGPELLAPACALLVDRGVARQSRWRQWTRRMENSKPCRVFRTCSSVKSRSWLVFECRCRLHSFGLTRMCCAYHPCSWGLCSAQDESTRLIGYFALMQLLRMHSLLGDYRLAMDAWRQWCLSGKSKAARSDFRIGQVGGGGVV